MTESPKDNQDSIQKTNVTNNKTLTNQNNFLDNRQNSLNNITKPGSLSNNTTQSSLNNDTKKDNTDSHSAASDLQSLSSSTNETIPPKDPKPLQDEKKGYRAPESAPEHAADGSGDNLDQISRMLTHSSANTVPRKKRRGLFIQFCLLPEYKDARNYSPRVKTMIVFIIATAAVIGPMGTSIILPAIDDVTQVLDTTVSTVNVSVGIYLLALGVFPLWWSSISENNGRRTVYLLSFALFFCFSIGSSLAPNISSLIVFRFLMGASSASVQSVGAGTISDLYKMEERGTAMGYFYLGPLLGPLFAPIIGGAVAIKWGFRGTSWFLVIFSGCLLVFLIVCLPETLRRNDNLINVLEKLEGNEQTPLSQMEKISNNERISNERISNERISNERISNERISNNERTNQIERISTNQTGRTLSRITTNLTLEEEEFLDQNRAPYRPIYDTTVPVLSRISTVDRRQAEQLEEATLQRVKTQLEQEKQQSLQGSVQSKQSLRNKLYIYLIKPTKSLVFLRYPPVLVMIIYSAVSFMCVYFVNMTITYEYSRAPYNFGTMLVGLTYIPNSVTYMLASIFSGRWIDKMVRDFEKKHGYLNPEARLSWNCYISAVVLPCALIIIGWCFNFHTHWVTPLVGTAIWGFASMLIIGATVTYVVDSLPGKGATGVALNNLIRQILATIACFVVEPLIRALGVGVLFLILAGILLVFGGSFIIIKKYSSGWREHYDLKKLYAIVDS